MSAFKCGKIVSPISSKEKATAPELVKNIFCKCSIFD